MREKNILILTAALILVAASWGVADEGAVSMFGNTPDRNMISPATDLPSSWDPEQRREHPLEAATGVAELWWSGPGR